MKKLMMVMSAALFALGARAETETDANGVTWSYTVSNGKATVTGASPCIGEIMVPTMLADYPVVSIAAEAFYCEAGVLGVFIPEGIKSIGNNAFYHCTSLRRVNIPDTVETLDDRTGYNGTGLFNGCAALEDVRLPWSLKNIPSGCFYGCTSLKAIELPACLSKINDCAFYGCASLIGLTFPKDGLSIGWEAFYGCRALTDLSIPRRVTVDETAFIDCCGLRSISVEEGNTSVKVTNGCLVSAAGDKLIAAPSGNLEVVIPDGVDSIPASMFKGAVQLKRVALPSSLLTIGVSAFDECSSLEFMEFPAGFSSFDLTRFGGSDAFYKCVNLHNVTFNGHPPANLLKSRLLDYCVVTYPHACGAEWRKIIGIEQMGGYCHSGMPTVSCISAGVRTSDPTVMDVVYKVTCAKPAVKVRALAFQDGERSFAKVVRPTEFIEDTAKNIGDAIPANEEHKLSWRVSTDWKVDLAKVKFEVLASDGDLLPLELTTIPKIGDHAAMEISWNAMTEQQVLDALLWLYADGDEGLTVVDGKLKNGTTQLANAASLSTTAAIAYVYSKMGFSVLSGDNLKYANEMTRLGLSPSGVRQYAWREVND